MKLSMIIIILAVMMGSTDGDCPSSVNCPDGKDLAIYVLAKTMYVVS